MKKLICMAALLLGSMAANAQIPIVGLVSSAIKKVITALDIKVQQMQN